MARVFYDADNNKDVYDISGAKTVAEVQAEFGLGVNTQQVDLLPDEAAEVVAGALQKFNAKTRNEQAAIDRENSRQGKETSIKAKLGFSNQEFADLKEALG